MHSNSTTKDHTDMQRSRASFTKHPLLGGNNQKRPHKHDFSLRRGWGSCPCQAFLGDLHWRAVTPRSLTLKTKGEYVWETQKVVGKEKSALTKHRLTHHGTQHEARGIKSGLDHTWRRFAG